MERPPFIESCGYDSFAMTTVLYNGVLLLLDVPVLWVVAKRRSAMGAVAGLAGICFGSLMLAFLLGENLFGVARLLSYGIFLHGSLLLAVFGMLFRKTARKSAVLSAVLAVLLLAVAVDAFLIEPHWLETTHLQIRSSKVRRPYRIALVADIQTDAIGDYERRVIARLLEERPQLILLAGDYLQDHGPALEPLRREFRELLRPLGTATGSGTYAVQGNMDPADWTSMFDGLPVTTMHSSKSVDIDDIRLVGLSLADSFNPRLVVPASEKFQIVLGHSPDFALGNVPSDLLLAGHTHGGQVRIPGFGPLMTLSQVPRSWAAGATPLDGNRMLVVSRGIGMERDAAPRLRFFCRPELVLIDIEPQRP